jgi:Cdc6-like AAA superfamily ATPase
MITDARVLQAEFVPQEVAHRDAEVNDLSRALQPITGGDPGETAFLFGPSGTGKTCIAQFTVDRLREEVLDINHQYVNCWQDHSRFKTLYRVLDGIEQTLDIHQRSTPHAELLERLHDYDGPPYVVILDEVDQLDDKSLLYDFYRIRGLSMVLIANREEDLFASLDERLTSRLHSSRRIQFNKYGIDELVTILEARAEWGLEPEAIGREGLERIADAAAGDSRVAIGILKSAARTAEQEDTRRITTEVIADSIPEGRAAVKQRNLKALTSHQRTLYEIVTESGEVDPGELYGQYQERVSDPKTKRTVRNYLQKMCHYNLIIAEGANRARTYRPVE